MRYALLLLAAPALADTLTMQMSGPMTLDDNGRIQTCTPVSITMQGSMANVRAMSITGMTVMAHCVPQVIVPPPSLGYASWTASRFIASLSLGGTYVSARRTGTGSLSVPWSTSGGKVSPAFGTLLWTAGDTQPKWIPLRFSAPGSVTLTLPGSTSILEIQ